MESTVSASDKVELIEVAIQQLIESKQASGAQTPFTDSDEDRRLLANLMSQLESLKGDVLVKPSEPKVVPSCADEEEVEEKGKEEAKTPGAEVEDVVKELKKLEKQNKITHWLLSGLIILTVAWQLSEMSLLLKLKHGVSHPFKSLGNMLTGMLKPPKSNGFEDENQSSSANQNNGAEIPLKLPHLDLTGLMNHSDE